jgi:predicted DNA-binding transcriptional regulator AlpA
MTTCNNTATLPSWLTFPDSWQPGTLLTPRDVAWFLSIGQRPLWRLVAAGVLPRPLRLSGKTVRWTFADITEVLAAGRRRGARPAVVRV